MNKEPKCRPIPFSSAMVLALLAGRKTQTRRMLKEQPKFDFPVRYDGLDFHNAQVHWWERLVSDGERGLLPTEDYVELGKCPYGVPGDRLWVKEQWRVENSLDDLKPSEIESHYPVDYAADNGKDWMHPAFAGRWRSARFMPRWASRLTLELLEVRVERLQDIDSDDAQSEGCFGRGYQEMHPNGFQYTAYTTFPREEYAEIWDSLHGDKPGERWADNPWVWVLSFKRVETAVSE